MIWKEISVLTTGNCVDAVAGVFGQLGSGGVQIEDPQAARTYQKNDHGQKLQVDEDFYNHEFVLVKAYFPPEKDVVEQLKKSIQLVSESFGERCKVFIKEINEIDGEDWENSWKVYYHAFNVGRILIKPSWEERLLKENEVLVEIDPGMAFGTGIHASTRFCLRFVDQYIKGGERVADAGCGSGILSIAAARLGAISVLGWDIDELAVRIARDNVELNGLKSIIRLDCGDAVENLAGSEFDVILANITADLVVELIPEAAKVLVPGGMLFGSGIVEGRWPSVRDQLERHGFEVVEMLKDIDWIGVAARKLQQQAE